MYFLIGNLFVANWIFPWFTFVYFLNLNLNSTFSLDRNKNPSQIACNFVKWRIDKLPFKFTRRIPFKFNRFQIRKRWPLLFTRHTKSILFTVYNFLSPCTPNASRIANENNSQLTFSVFRDVCACCARYIYF